MAPLFSSSLLLLLLPSSLLLLLLLLPHNTHAEITPDKWPQLEVPTIPEDPDYTQIQLSRMRDGYLAVNTKTDPSITAELLVGDVLEQKGYSPEQIYAMQQIVSVLVKSGLVEVHEDKIAAADLSAIAGQITGTSNSSSSNATTATPTTQHQKRYLQDRGCCPCDIIGGHHPKPPSTPRPYNKAAQLNNNQVVKEAAADCHKTLRGCDAKATQLAGERRSMYKTLKVYGLALRRTAAARSYYLYLQDEVHSYEEFSALSEVEQEETRKEMAQQLLLTCKEYGLKGEELHKYGAILGLDVPDLTKESNADLKKLGAEMASEHMMEKLAIAMGKDMSVEALKQVRDAVGDAALKRIGIEPSPELNDAFMQFATEASKFIAMSKKAMVAQGMIDPAAEAAYMNATATADRIAAQMEKVNVTDVLLTATGLMLEAEPYLADAIDHPVDPSTRKTEIPPWEIVLRLSKLQKAAQQERKSFTVTLKDDNALDGILLLHTSGKVVESPIYQELNFTKIEAITADHMMDANELSYLVQRVGALNEIYTVDDFAELMAEVETNYRQVNGLPPIAKGGASAGAGAVVEEEEKFAAVVDVDAQGGVAERNK